MMMYGWIDGLTFVIEFRLFGIGIPRFFTPRIIPPPNSLLARPGSRDRHTAFTQKAAEGGTSCSFFAIMSDLEAAFASFEAEISGIPVRPTFDLDFAPSSTTANDDYFPDSFQTPSLETAAAAPAPHHSLAAPPIRVAPNIPPPPQHLSLIHI